MINAHDLSDLEKQRQIWDKMRKHGKTRFILYRTVLGGICCTFADSCIELLVFHKRVYHSPLFLGFITLIWCLVCFIVSLSAWRRNERQFRNDSKQ